MSQIASSSTSFIQYTQSTPEERREEYGFEVIQLKENVSWLIDYEHENPTVRAFKPTCHTLEEKVYRDLLSIRNLLAEDVEEMKRAVDDFEKPVVVFEEKLHGYTPAVDRCDPIMKVVIAGYHHPCEICIVWRPQPLSKKEQGEQKKNLNYTTDKTFELVDENVKKDRMIDLLKSRLETMTFRTQALETAKQQSEQEANRQISELRNQLEEEQSLIGTMKATMKDLEEAYNDEIFKKNNYDYKCRERAVDLDEARERINWLNKRWHARSVVLKNRVKDARKANQAMKDAENLKKVQFKEALEKEKEKNRKLEEAQENCASCTALKKDYNQALTSFLDQQMQNTNLQEENSKLRTVNEKLRKHIEKWDTRIESFMNNCDKQLTKTTNGLRELEEREKKFEEVTSEKEEKFVAQLELLKKEKDRLQTQNQELRDQLAQQAKLQEVAHPQIMDNRTHVEWLNSIGALQQCNSRFLNWDPFHLPQLQVSQMRVQSVPVHFVQAPREEPIPEDMDLDVEN